MLRVSKGLAVFCMLGWALSGWAEEAPRGNPHLTVFVSNDAGASDHVIAEAERDATRIFQRAGVDVDWVHCLRAGARDENPGCGGQTVMMDLAVRIVPHARTLPPEIFGVSFLADGRGAYADVFLDPIQRLREVDQHVSLAAILGDVMAHELGHLLLGSNAHSREGIMQPHWEGQQLRGIAMGQMRFTAEQAERMRSRIVSLQKKSTPVLAAGTR